MEPALAGDRPRRFAALVESWHWSARAPAKAKGGEWQSYRPLTIYRDREDITSHPPLLDLLKSIEHSVKTGASTKLVIQGETGTGKEIIARWVHRLLAERKNCQPHELPIKVISPAGVTKELAQSMLFGHYKGAFTDAHADRKGALELALGGLLLLDDLQEIPLPVQAMLLRALEYGELERMGAQTSYSFAEGNAELDLFLVCTVNRPIRELIEAGKVLQDLWHRLRKDGDYLLLPPLRERREDALRAAEAVWQDLCVKLGNQGSLPDNLRSALQKEQLDGNFRAVHSIVRSHYMVRRQQAAGLSVDVLNEHLAQMLAGIVGNGDAPGPRPGGRRGDDPPVVTWILGNRQRLERERKPIAEDGLNGELAWLAWACRRYCSDHGGRPPIELKRRHFQVLLSRKYSNNRYSDAMKAAADWIQEGNKPAETKYLLKDQAS